MQSMHSKHSDGHYNIILYHIEYIQCQRVFFIHLTGTKFFPPFNLSENAVNTMLPLRGGQYNSGQEESS
jgi:hypothetical protein